MEQYYIIVGSPTVEVNNGMTAFSKTPFGFMQSNKGRMNTEEINKAIDHFYDSIFTSLEFKHFEKNGRVAGWTFNLDGEKMSVGPEDRFFINRKFMSMDIEYADKEKAKQEVYYGGAIDQFKNYANGLTRRKMARMPATITAEELKMYATGCVDSSVMDFYIGKFNEHEIRTYQPGDGSLIIYTIYDDHTHAQVTYHKMQQGN